MLSEDKSGKLQMHKAAVLYRLILISFALLLVFSSIVMLLALDMYLVPLGFLLSSPILLLSVWFLKQKRALLSVHIITQIFPVIFVVLSVVSKMHNEGTSLIFYIAPRFGILVTILLPFLILGTQNHKQLFYATVPAIFWFFMFDAVHSMAGIKQSISFSQTDYPFVVAGSLIMLILAVLIIYLLQNVNEKYEALIIKQRDDLQQAQQKISDSIAYASRIQASLLMGENILEKQFADYFLIFQPRDVVSGDFFWIRQKDNKTFCMAADCTGHGVPGAFVSMLGIAYLNEIQNMENLSAASVLEILRQKIKISFAQNKEGRYRQDGMDAAFCIIDHQNWQINYSGAHNPIFVVEKQNQLTEYKSVPNTIGFNAKEIAFKDVYIPMQSGDKLFMFSDGYGDQLGGQKNRKITKHQLSQLIHQNSGESFFSLKNILIDYWQKWKAEKSQTDDILVLGVEIK